MNTPEQTIWAVTWRQGTALFSTEDLANSYAARCKEFVEGEHWESSGDWQQDINSRKVTVTSHVLDSSSNVYAQKQWVVKIGLKDGETKGSWERLIFGTPDQGADIKESFFHEVDTGVVEGRSTSCLGYALAAAMDARNKFLADKAKQIHSDKAMAFSSTTREELYPDD